MTPAELGMTRAIALDHANNRVIRRNNMGIESVDEDGNGDEDNEDGGPTGDPVDQVRTIVIDSGVSGATGLTAPRSLSISDPDGGYASLTQMTGVPTENAGDGVRLLLPLDTPLDAGAPARDIAAIWTNGVTDNFRFAYLQRLANPLLPHNTMSNPYLTIDTAGVDLLAFNGLTQGLSLIHI